MESVIPLSISNIKDSSMRLILTQEGLNLILAGTLSSGGYEHLFISNINTAGV